MPRYSTAIRRYPWTVKALVFLLAGFLAYGLLEAAATAYDLWFSRTPFVICERTETNPCTFDPASGYRFGQGRRRFAMLVPPNTVEFSSSFSVNTAGFRDNAELTPQRRGGGPRLAVFGDSFTSALHLSRNWPERAEQFAAEQGRELDLVNLSLDGAGLANWRNIVCELLDHDEMQLDGVAFALYPDDLWRMLVVQDTLDSDRVRLWYASGWQPERLPRDRSDIQTKMGRWPLFVVSSHDYDNHLARRQRPFRLLVWEMATVYGSLTQVLLNRLRVEEDLDARRGLIDDIAKVLQRRGWPAYVFVIPDRPRPDQTSFSRAEDYYDPRRIRDCVDFAWKLRTRPIDGAAMFEGVPEEEVRQSWQKVDPHWNERGSDRFGEFVAQRLLDEFAARPAAAEGN